MDNYRILVIPDLHFPYCHPDALDFIHKIVKLMSPSRVICLGDELDYHAMSFHNSDPDLDSAGVELLKAIGYISHLKSICPKMDLLDSNHGSMAYRKAKFNGMPRHLIKSYREVLEVDNDWNWHDQLILSFPNGSRCQLYMEYQRIYFPLVSQEECRLFKDTITLFLKSDTGMQGMGLTLPVQPDA